MQIPHTQISINAPTSALHLKLVSCIRF